MAYRQGEDPVIESKGQTSRRHAVVSPLFALPDRLRETGEHTISDISLDGLPILPSEDIKKTRPPTTTPAPQRPIPAPEWSQQTEASKVEGFKKGDLQVPPFNRARPPAQPRQHTEGLRKEDIVRVSSPPPQQKEKLVQVVPLLQDTNYPAQQQTGGYRWEKQTSRYPVELLELIESETREMQAVVVNAPASPQTKQKRIRRRRRRVPEMRQVTAVECGAACLAMALNYYGYATSVSEVQEHCGVGRDGLTALEIVKSAQKYGLRVRAVSLKLEDFRFVALPAIVHWEFNHFLVVERWSTKYVDVVDPALGRRRLSAEEFDEGFTGVAIMVEPGAQFAQRTPQKSLTVWSYVHSFTQMRVIILQILGASLLLQLIGLGSPLLTEVVIDRILPAKDIDMLTLMGVGMLILVLMQAIAGFLRSSLLIYLQTRIDAHMMLNFFEHLLSLPYRFFQLRLNGDLLARVNSNLAIRDLLTNQFISTLLDGGTVIVYFVILLFLSRLLAEVTLGIGLIQIALLLFTAPAIRRLTQRDLEAQGKTQGYLNEALSGIATLKAAGAEHRALARWENLFFDEMNVSLRLSYLSSVVGSLLGIVGMLSPLVLLWIGAQQVINGTMTVGAMLALNTLAVQFLGPLGSLATSGQQLQVVRSHFARIADVIGAQPEQDPTAVQTPQKLTGRIELRRVSFRYDQNAPLILQDINARIQPGQKVALVGRTGSGKSTLGKLLVGLITPTKGSILLDGVPLENLNYQEVRNQFGVVLQESFIFSGSVKENIALNNPEMDMEQISEAAHLAAIDEDIEKMPMSYDTLVSEGGSAFSGGQRQRLALARALANHPALLLLDEATSALDVATEHVVEQNLSRLPCTQVIIAHRLSTIRNADMILVLDRGHIVEQGTHEQLLRRNGFYAELIQAQLRNGEIVKA